MKIIIQMGDPFFEGVPCANRIRIFNDVFLQKGHDVKILTPKIDKLQKSSENIIYCPTVLLKNKSAIRRFLNSICFAVSSFFISIKFGKADVVITTSPPPFISISGWLIAKVLHAKLVYDVRDIWPDVAWEIGSFDKNSLYSKCFSFIRDFMLKHSDLVTTVSLGKVEKLKKYCPKAEVLYIGNGLDELFLKNEEIKNFSDKFNMGNHFNCIYIGNIGLAQGLMQFMKIAEKALKSYPDVQFILFGTGVDEKNIKKYVYDNNLTNVVFAGRVSNAEIYTALKNANISFVSLVNDKLTDSVPTKMFEALGAGCPVLLSAAGESVDILNESGLGIAVSPNNEKALWDAFEKMYNNLPAILENTERAKEHILKKYSRQQAALDLEKRLTEL